jgi:prefoldin subunit 5
MSEGLILFLSGQTVMIITALIGIYVRMNVRLAEIDIRVKVSEKRLADLETKEDKMNEKLDKILDEITDVKVELQNKENRK